MLATFLLGFLAPWTFAAAEVRVARQAQEPSLVAQQVTVTSAKRFPVSKVVTLLNDMAAELQKEAEMDEETFDKMSCWCKTNDRETSTNLEEANQHMAELTTTIETTSADSARLKQEIQNHEEDLTKSTESLGTATSMREKQAEEFNGEEKDMLQSIQALGSAIVVLGKHHGQNAFLDGGRAVTPSQARLQFLAMESVKMQMQMHSGLLLGTITPRQRRLIESLTQGQSESQDAGYSAGPAHLQGYAPQSSEIFGILRQMKETFETNLDESRKEEKKNSESYQELKSAKEEEIKATSDAINSKQTQLADTDERHVLAQQDLDDTRNSISYDDVFLQDLKTRCAASQQEYDERVTMRQEEMSAVAEAVQILSSDEAHDTFSSTFNAGAASLLQERSSAREARRNQRKVQDDAAAVLAAAADKAADPKLSALAIVARLDPMTKVKAAIDKLIAELIQEKKEEIDHRDSCVDRTNDNERDIERHTRTHQDLESEKTGLETNIKEITQEVEALQAEIKQSEVEIKRAGEDRELANHDFQQTVADQKATQRLLQRALAVLQKVYSAKEAPKAGASLLQVQAMVGQAPLPTPPPPPEGFSSYGSGRAKGGVIGLLQQIIRDAVEMEKQALRDEQGAQEEYENFVKDTNQSVDAKNNQITNKRGDKARAEQTLSATSAELRSEGTEVETLHSTQGAIKLECDFIMRNFDVRQDARDQEVEALRQAKAILSGMQAEA
mmetsp:Transcript_68286/g.200486  ORF Transcript_68286/g.200486 Transcript_68286/m.200486 type:complete len:729 (-) Transcript_68286:89-2275(-)